MAFEVDGTKFGDYSTSETWTGEYWIDGKKIYRKVLSYSNYNIASGSNYFSMNVSDVDTFVSIYYSFLVGGFYLTNWENIANVKGHPDTKQIEIQTVNTNGLTVDKFLIVVEYTKTN